MTTETAPATPRLRPESAWARIPDHVVKLTIGGVWGVEAKLTCQAPEGSWCRLQCPSCEESCTCGADPIDAGKCLAVEWIEAEDAASELFGDDETDAVSGPAEVWWDGDVWHWGYPGGTGDQR